TLGQFVVYSGTSLPFNIAHAVGNVLFCLAFGPAFVRALLRFRERFAVRFEPVAAAGAAKAATTTAAVALVAAIAFAAAPAPRAQAADAATRRATAYIVRAQNRDGGFGAKAGQPSAALETAWSAMGRAARARHGRRRAHDPRPRRGGPLAAERGRRQPADDADPPPALRRVVRAP